MKNKDWLSVGKINLESGKKFCGNLDNYTTFYYCYCLLHKMFFIICKTYVDASKD